MLCPSGRARPDTNMSRLEGCPKRKLNNAWQIVLAGDLAE